VVAVALALRFGPEDLLRCRFALSPLWETTNAVRTLAEPQRHGYHLPWLRQVQAQLPRLELAPLLAVQPRRGYTPDFLAPPPQSPLVTIDQELDRVRSTPADVVAVELDRCLAQREGAPPAALRALLADPAAAAERLSQLLERCWQVLLAPWWERIRDLLDGDIAFRARRLADGGLERLFADLDPSVRFDGDTLAVGGRGEGHRDLAGEGLVLMPSAFVWPGVVLVLDLPWQPTLIYPARGIAGLWQPPPAQPPVALGRLLGRSRAKLLLALAEPASTAALARRLGHSPSAVSKHLSALRDAGLLISHRVRHQVIYERTPSASPWPERLRLQSATTRLAAAGLVSSYRMFEPDGRQSDCSFSVTGVTRSSGDEQGRL
jgi:DNA-binding transcriptional ArsR family regulator